VSNDGSTGYQYAVMYDTSAGANKSIRLLKTQNPYYGLAIDGGNAQVEGSTGMTDIPATIYGGGAGASLAGSGGLSLYGGHGGGANKNNAATGNGSFPGGGGGSNDSDNGNGGDGAAGIVVVYTKRTVL
jgi:hypothetical protein